MINEVFQGQGGRARGRVAIDRLSSPLSGRRLARRLAKREREKERERESSATVSNIITHSLFPLSFFGTLLESHDQSLTSATKSSKWRIQTTHKYDAASFSRTSELDLLHGLDTLICIKSYI